MDHASAVQSAYGRIYGLMQGQANLLAYIDTIEVFAVLCFLVVPLAFLMKKNTAARGPVGAH